MMTLQALDLSLSSSSLLNAPEVTSNEQVHGTVAVTPHSRTYPYCDGFSILPIGQAPHNRACPYCDRFCILPIGHGGQCQCENNHRWF